jgi:hypothetical protein
MLRIFLLDRVLRASVAPKGFALASSSRDGFLPAADPMGKMIAWESQSIISILRYRVPVARRPRMSDWGELAAVHSPRSTRSLNVQP